jgi:acyl dehydratase
LPLDLDALSSWRFDPVVQDYSERDTILYALGVGVGLAPAHPRQLPFVYEEGLCALPTMAVVLGSPGLFLRDPRAGVAWKHVLHGEQSMRLHRPLPRCGRVVAQSRVDGVVDKGEGRGALVYASRELRDAATDAPICTLQATYVCRADGGFGGPPGPVRPRHPVPDREPDRVVDLPTSPQAALIYRLSGDRNPLHADPAVAAQAGFPAPILHGLCTYGVAGHALLKELCDYAGERVLGVDARFSRPVFPGETIRTEVWEEAPGEASYRCRALERDVVIIDDGRFEYAPDGDGAP